MPRAGRVRPRSIEPAKPSMIGSGVPTVPPSGDEHAPGLVDATRGGADDDVDRGSGSGGAGAVLSLEPPSAPAPTGVAIDDTSAANDNEATTAERRGDRLVRLTRLMVVDIVELLGAAHRWRRWDACGWVPGDRSAGGSLAGHGHSGSSADETPVQGGTSFIPRIDTLSWSERHHPRWSRSEHRPSSVGMSGANGVRVGCLERQRGIKTGSPDRRLRTPSVGDAHAPSVVAAPPGRRSAWSDSLRKCPTRATVRR